MNLYMVLLGCRPKGRLTEQHDVFFTIAPSLFAAKQQMFDSWPEAKGIMHIDAYQHIRQVEGWEVVVEPRNDNAPPSEQYLFFVNLGGYTRGWFDEQHYKVLAVAKSSSEARNRSKRTEFFAKHNIPGPGGSHVDDLHGIDVDDLYNVYDLLSDEVKAQWQLRFLPNTDLPEDKVYLGYLPMKKLTDTYAEINNR
jgi:hypothetical protein